MRVEGRSAVESRSLIGLSTRLFAFGLYLTVFGLAGLAASLMDGTSVSTIAIAAAATTAMGWLIIWRLVQRLWTVGERVSTATVKRASREEVFKSMAPLLIIGLALLVLSFVAGGSDGGAVVAAVWLGAGIAFLCGGIGNQVRERREQQRMLVEVERPLLSTRSLLQGRST